MCEFVFYGIYKCVCVCVGVWTDASGSLYPQLSEFMGLNLSIEAIKAFSSGVPEQSSGVSVFVFLAMHM